MVAEVIGLAVDAATHPPAGQGGEIGNFEQGDPIGLGGLRHSLGYGMVRASRQTRGNAAAAGRLRTAPCHEIGLRGLAMRDRAGLVQRQPAQLAALFQIDATLDQNAAACGCGQAADDGDRRGNHKSARTGNDQQNQRAVNPVQPRGAHEQWRHQCDDDGYDEYDGCVPAGKLIHKALGRRTAALGGLYGMDDAGQRRVGGHGCDAVLERTGFVDRAGEHRIAKRLFNRQAFAGDRRLIDRGMSYQYFAIEGDPFSRFDSNTGANGDLLGVHIAPCVVGLSHGGLFRGQVE